MNRRELFGVLPAIATVSSGLAAQAKTSTVAVHPGLVAYSFRKELANGGMTYDDLIHLAAASGLQGIDTTAYWFPNTSASFLAGLRSNAYRNGIHLYSLGVRVRLCQPTPELQAAEVENCKKWIDVAERMGAGHIRAFGGSAPKNTSEEQAIAWAVEVLKRCAEYAATKGIIIGVEDDGGLTTTAEPTVAIVKGADSPFVGINVDTGNFPKNGYAQVSLCLPYATNVHFKTHIADENGNKQDADWPRLANMFSEAGYKGFLSLEYEEDGNAVTAVPSLLRKLVSLCAKCG
jgi:sugar phosphate isomerase/epimerase